MNADGTVDPLDDHPGHNLQWKTPASGSDIDPLLGRLGELAAAAGRWSLTSAPEAAREALRPLLRGARLSRFRLLDIACPDQHRFAQVVRTASGPLVLGMGQAVRGYSVTEGEIGSGRRLVASVAEHRHRAQPVTYLLPRLHAAYRVEVQCTCRRAEIPVEWIREQLAAGRKRVVWRGMQ